MSDVDCRITPNAEIAGIGIRTSIYAQAILTCVLAGLSLFRYAVVKDITAVTKRGQDLEHVDPTRDEVEFLLKSDLPMQKVLKRLQQRYQVEEQEDNRDLRTARMSVQLTGVALIISALVQSNLYSLDVYHALVVFNLCWLSNITAIMLYLTELFLKNPRDRFLKHPLPPRLWTWEGLQAADPFLPTSLYLCAQGGYGLWLFIRLPVFGDDPSNGWIASQCNSVVHYWLFGNIFPVTAQGFRIAGIVLNVIACIPIFNIIVESYIMCYGAQRAINVVLLPYRIFRRVGGKKISVDQHVVAPKYQHMHFLRTLVALACIYVFFVIVFLLDSEEMIGVNAPNIDEDEENQWTFGQTLVMVLLYPLIWDIFLKSKEMYYLIKEKKEEDGMVEKAVLQLRDERAKQEKEGRQLREGGMGTNSGASGRDDSAGSDIESPGVTRSQTFA